MCLEDINEKASGYGNHNDACIVIKKATAIYKIAYHIQTVWPIQLEILNLHLWCDDASNEIQN